MIESHLANAFVVPGSTGSDASPTVSSHEAASSTGPDRRIRRIGGPAAVDIHDPGSGVWQVKVQELAKALREAE